MMTVFILIQSSEMTLVGGSGLPHISFWGQWEYAVFLAEETKADSPGTIYASFTSHSPTAHWPKQAAWPSSTSVGQEIYSADSSHLTKVWGWSVLLRVEGD